MKSEAEASPARHDYGCWACVVASDRAWYGKKMAIGGRVARWAMPDTALWPVNDTISPASQANVRILQKSDHFFGC